MTDLADNEDHRLGKWPVIAYFAVVVSVCLPIWFVDHFYNGDGPTHLHSASLMVELARGGSAASGFYSFNSVIVPNSLGHWLLAAMLSVTSAATASKLMASGLFCLWVAAAAWLRHSVSGSSGLVLAILFAGVLGLNRIWLVGLYNFVLGAIVILFALGLLVRWEGRLDLRRTTVLGVCFAAAFFSHLVTFGILGLAVGIYILIRSNEPIRSLLLTGLAALPMLPFTILYQQMSASESTPTPAWYLLNSPLSISSLILHVRGTDPFFIIGRRYMPFLSVESATNALSAPLLWVTVAIVLLTAAAWKSGRLSDEFRSRWPMIAVAVVLLVLAAIAPDELGSSEGSVIRPRFLLVAMGIVVSFIAIPTSKLVVGAAAAILTAAFAFQTAALWDYALWHDKEIAEFTPVSDKVFDGERIASAMVFEEQLRFHPSPLQRVSSLVGIAKDVVVWDSYEMGYYFFPLIASSAEDRRTIREFTVTNIIRPQYADENFDIGVSRFGRQLEANHDKIDIMVVRGRNERIDAEVFRWFGPDPFFETENYRLFRRRVFNN